MCSSDLAGAPGFDYEAALREASARAPRNARVVLQIDADAMGELLLSLERETLPDLVHLNAYTHGALPFHCVAEARQIDPQPPRRQRIVHRLDPRRRRWSLDN